MNEITQQPEQIPPHEEVYSSAIRYGAFGVREVNEGDEVNTPPQGLIKERTKITDPTTWIDSALTGVSTEFPPESNEYRLIQFTKQNVNLQLARLVSNGPEGYDVVRGGDTTITIFYDADPKIAQAALEKFIKLPEGFDLTTFAEKYNAQPRETMGAFLHQTTDALTNCHLTIQQVRGDDHRWINRWNLTLHPSHKIMVDMIDQIKSKSLGSQSTPPNNPIA